MAKRPRAALEVAVAILIEPLVDGAWFSSAEEVVLLLGWRDAESGLLEDADSEPAGAVELPPTAGAGAAATVEFIAFAKNASKLFCGVALMLKTIPASQ